MDIGRPILIFGANLQIMGGGGGKWGNVILFSWGGGRQIINII